MLVVGLAEPEIQPWVRAAGHNVRAVRRVGEALAELDKVTADLVIVDREPGGLDAPGVCRALKADPRLEDAWLLAITVAAHKRTADAALDAGADDYLHRPFSRAELLARARAGLRAAQQRADDALVRGPDGERPRRDLPLGLARRLHARADQRRDRADLRLPAPRTSSPASGGR